MTERVNGYIIDNRLGTLMGENGFVSVAVRATNIEVDSTGVLTPLAQFKALYAIKPGSDIGASVTVPGTETGIALGAPGTTTGDVITHGPDVSVVNVPAALRTFGKKADGSPNVLADDAAYQKAWAAQENLRRIVDTVQQRAVLIAMSVAGPKAVAAAITGDATKDRAYGEWSRDLAVGDHQVVTFLVERRTSFDETAPNSYGQPGVTHIGESLVKELSKLRLVESDGVTFHELAATEYAVRIDSGVPQII